MGMSGTFLDVISRDIAGQKLMQQLHCLLISPGEILRPFSIY